MKIVNPQNLVTALASAGEGERLRLRAGDYPMVRVSKGMPRRDQRLVLEPHDPASPPRFVETLRLDDCSNLTFRGCDFDISTASTSGAPAVSIWGGEKLAFEGGRVVGRRTPNDRWGYGIKAKDVRGLSVRGMRLSTLRRCMGFGECDDLEVVDNDLWDIGTDGIDLGGIIRGLIARNYIADFYPIEKDHPDAIQIMQIKDNRGCDELKILDNLIYCSPEGRFRAQGTFGTGRTHRNIEIGRNIYISTNWNGIKLRDMKELMVHDNLVLFVPEAKLSEKAATKSWIGFERCEGRAWNNRAMKIGLDTVKDGGGNREISAATQGQADKAVKAWQAKFRGLDASAAQAVHVQRRARFDILDELKGVQGAGGTAFLRLGEA